MPKKGHRLPVGCRHSSGRLVGGYRLPKAFRNIEVVDVRGDSCWGKTYDVLNKDSGFVYTVDQQSAKVRTPGGANYIVSLKYGGMVSKFRTLNQALRFVSEYAGKAGSS